MRPAATETSVNCPAARAEPAVASSAPVIAINVTVFRVTVATKDSEREPPEEPAEDERMAMDFFISGAVPAGAWIVVSFEKYNILDLMAIVCGPVRTV